MWRLLNNELSTMVVFAAEKVRPVWARRSMGL
jgi:hypothetical protein